MQITSVRNEAASHAPACKAAFTSNRLKGTERADMHAKTRASCGGAAAQRRTCCSGAGLPFAGFAGGCRAGKK
eukprot:4639609-Pleurochrysis_carterae.AAC.1